MDFIILLLKQNILMFLYLLIGYFLFRKKLIGISGSADIGRMLLHIVMPAAILKAYMTSYTPERLIGLVPLVFSSSSCSASGYFYKPDLF